jgi:hypothetical protein
LELGEGDKAVSYRQGIGVKITVCGVAKPAKRALDFGL